MRTDSSSASCWLKVFGISVLLILGGASCGDDDTPNMQRPDDEAGDGAGTVPVPWVEVTRFMECTPPTSEPLCLEGAFNVSNEGEYEFEEYLLRGVLTLEEQAELDEIASSIADLNLQSDLICEPGASFPEIQSVQSSITRGGQAESVIYRFGQQDGICYRTDQELAFQFDEVLDRLAQKYWISDEESDPLPTPEED